MGAESHVLQLQSASEPIEVLCDGGSCEHRSDGSDITSNDDEPYNLSDMMAAVKVLLEGLGEDPTRDGLLRTPLRVAKAFREATIGYQQSALEVVQSAMFEEAAAAGGKGNGGGVGGMVVVRNIEVYPLCEGCLLPFRLRCHVGYIPSRERVVGLSKLARVAEIYAKRLQSPQRFVDELAQAFTDTLKPLGVAVVSESWHLKWPDASENRINGDSGKETVAWTHSAMCARRGQFEDKSAGDLLWNEFMGILALEGTGVKYPCAADSNANPDGRDGPHHACPFSEFDAHFLAGIGSQDSLQSKVLASNGHGEPQPRPNRVFALTTSSPNLIEAIKNLLRSVGDDPSRPQVLMTPWRFVGWLWTSTQGSRSPVPKVNYLEFHCSPNRTNTVGTNGLNCTHLNRAGLTVANNDRGVGIILGEFDLSFQSQCEHHLLPFLGMIHLGYLMGLEEVRRLDRTSLERIVKNYSSRLQVQERLTRQIAEAVGGSVMVVVEANHMCMLSRGVQQHASDTVTYASLGAFASDVPARTAFLQLVSAHRTCK